VGTFIVTSVTHEYDLKGAYRNTFSGVPDTTENIPMPPIRIPKAFSQPATVKSNDDVKKLGRVKVEFPWQKDKNKTTNWIRVATPDAGKSDKVPQNRGFVFIPEKDDLVMVDFEYGDPNRPYVSNSIFSERVSKGGDVNNKIKSITTRSGITITCDDDAGSVNIKDKNGSDSTIFLDGEKNIVINAGESITLVCGKSIIVLEKDGTITINGTKIFTVASDEINISAGNLEGGNSSGISVEPETLGITAAEDIVEVSNNITMSAAGGKNVIAMDKGGEITLNGSKINLN
jgi:uncharacterized protein involved in type VI secretion and phage assembly